jgi:hypothetical protein
MAARNKVANVECLLTHKEIARLLTERGYPTTAKVAWHLERQAIRKIASEPLIQRLAEEMGFHASVKHFENCGEA